MREYRFSGAGNSAPPTAWRYPGAVAMPAPSKTPNRRGRLRRLAACLSGQRCHRSGEIAGTVRGDAVPREFRYGARMSAATMTPRTALADRVLTTLRAHEAELRAAGVRRLSLFGSVARGDDQANSDVDLAAELDPAARIDLVSLIGLERRLAEMVGRPVDLLPEPVEKARLRANIERDRIRVF